MSLIFVILFLLIGFSPDANSQSNYPATCTGCASQAWRENFVGERVSSHMNDLTGKQFGMLTVLNLDHKLKQGRHVRVKWKCLCKCGTLSIVVSDNLVGGHTKSCGCFKVEATRISKTTHGHTSGWTRTRTYRAWSSAKERCNNPLNKGWPNYGGRGIIMHPDWNGSFDSFLSNMGECPPRHTIDRINNNGNYEPGNCRWVTQAVQNRNYSRNVNLTFNGETKIMTDWAILFGIKPRTLSRRIKLGWPLEKAFSPIVKK